MIPMTQNTCLAQKILLSSNSDEIWDVTIVGGYLLDLYQKHVSRTIRSSRSEYLPKKDKGTNQSVPAKEMPFQSLKDEFFINYKRSNLNEPFYKEPLRELMNEIYNVYHEHEYDNWDGYGAEPIKYLEPALQFANDLFSESRMLIESVNIIPENDGCLCFEWFKSSNECINISVKNDKLIYLYEFGDEEGCGEVSFSGKQMLIDQIKKIA